MSLMLRDYKLFEIEWSGDLPIYEQARDAPGSGEMSHYGEFSHETHVWRCVARSEEQARLVFAERHKYGRIKKQEIRRVTANEINCILLQITE